MPKGKSIKDYAARMKSKYASGRKKKLGDASLDWIADTTGSESVLQKVENFQTKEDGILKETKIGVVKKFASGEAGKKKEAAIESHLGISTSSSTITKGKKLARAKKEVITVEEVEKKLGGKKGSLMAKAPVEATKEKEAPAAEVHVEAAGEKIEGEAPHIPDDLSTIVKKKAEPAWKEAEGGEKEEAVEKKEIGIRTWPPRQRIYGEKEKATEKKETAAPIAAFTEKVAATGRKGWSKIVILAPTLKEGGLKISETVIKQVKSGKFKESVGSALKTAKHPIKAVADIDRKITRSMKKVVVSGSPKISGNSLSDNIKAADAQITKSVKKMIDSIL